MPAVTEDVCGFSVLVQGNRWGGSARMMLEAGSTLPETNISPENRPLEKEIPIGSHHF